MKLRFHIERLLFNAILFSARILPRRFFLILGKWFGRLALIADGRHRRVAMENLATAMPHLASQERRAILRHCYEFFGTYLFEMLTCFPKFSPDRMKDIEFEGLENLETAYGKKKGVIILTAHFGAWELMGMAHGFKGYPMGVIARTLDNPFLHRMLETLRCSTGNFVINKKEGFRPMLKALKEGKAIAILIDQNVITDDRVFVDFFGKAAATTPAVGLLKLKTEATIVPAFALPLRNGRFRFSYLKPLEVPLTGDRKADVLGITQECTRVIEEQVRTHPEFWLWMHRRWKTRPDETAEAGRERQGETEDMKIANF